MRFELDGITTDFFIRNGWDKTMFGYYKPGGARFTDAWALHHHLNDVLDISLMDGYRQGMTLDPSHGYIVLQHSGSLSKRSLKLIANATLVLEGKTFEFDYLLSQPNSDGDGSWIDIHFKAA